VEAQRVDRLARYRAPHLAAVRRRGHWKGSAMIWGAVAHADAGTFEAQACTPAVG
jgi:hypothetical protein